MRSSRRAFFGGHDITQDRGRPWNEEPALAEIVQTLNVDHSCHAVILYGSRARGDFQLTSDWDVAGIREAGATVPLRVARAFHGAWLDAFVYAEAAFATIDPDLLRFLPARILVDERGFAKTLIERVAALDREGPPPLPEGEDEMVRVWYAKMLERIARGDLESKYRRVELLYQALENYFKLRGLWYRGPRAGLPWLARHDPETHAVFARALDEPHTSLEDLRALVQRVLQPEKRSAASVHGMNDGGSEANARRGSASEDRAPIHAMEELFAEL